MCRRHVPVVAVLLAISRVVAANEPPLPDSRIRLAIERAIPLLEAGSAGSAEQRTCFTCHSQALPILALAEVKRRGLAIDDANLKRQLAHTLAHLERGTQNFLQGKGQGGKSISAGYALWALNAGEHASDETTTAVVTFLIKDQKNSGQWRHPGSRPPSSGSDFTTTYMALRGLQAYGADDQRPAIESTLANARQWLADAKPEDTEDRVFQLHALDATELSDKLKQQSVTSLLEAQRDDGGWAQTAELKSDAYATGSAIVALLRSSGLPSDDRRLQQGLRFLIESQLDDGSWHVATRAKGFQEYFESGFPHAEDQFISIAASSWATWALAIALREPSVPSGD